MTKKITILVIGILFLTNLSAQDIILNFSGEVEATGTPVTPQNITIENLSSGGSVNLGSNTSVNLTTLVGIENILEENNTNGFSRVYPNPFSSELNIELNIESEGVSSVFVYNMTGQIVASFSKKLKTGTHKCTFTPKNRGVYFITLQNNGKTYTSKAISSNSSNSVATLQYIEQVSEKNITSLRKATKSSFFEPGDVLRYTATYNDYTATIYDSPTENRTYTFGFAERFFRFEGYYTADNYPSFVDVIYSVTDQYGKGVDYLTNEDFTVKEDDAVVSPSETFRYVKKLDEVPYRQKTVLMLDNSASLMNDLDKIKAAAISMVNQIAPYQYIAIYTFSDTPVLLTGDQWGEQIFTQDITQLENAINSITIGYPSTDLYGSIITGLNSWNNSYSLEGIGEGYMIVMTDGDDTQGSYTLQNVIDARGNKKVYMIGLGNDLTPAPLNDIANPGDYIPVTSIEDLEQTFIDIQYDIVKFANSFYWMNYMSPKRNGTHTLRVEAVDNDNTDTDSYTESSFNADGFLSVTYGLYVHASPNWQTPSVDPENVYGVTSIDFEYNEDDQTNFLPIHLKATTYWANVPPIYLWTINNENVATFEIDPVDHSIITVTPQPVFNESTTLTLQDISNNYSTEININLTHPKPIVFTNDEVTNITYNSFVLSGEVTYQGTSDITEYGFEINGSKHYIEGSNPTSFLYEYTSSYNYGNYSYDVRAYAENSSGISYGEYVSFTTQEFGEPVVNNPNILSVNTDNAILYSTIIYNGGVDITEKGICYSTSPDPSIEDNAVIFTSLMDENYVCDIAGLTEGITYYAKAYAINSYGVGYSDEIQFKPKAHITGQTGAVTDIDGNTYNTIGIGPRMWMAENIEATHLNDGTVIEGKNPDVHSSDDGMEGWETWSFDFPAYFLPENEYKLYNFEAAQSVCPTGWHLPSDAEYIELAYYLGGTDVAGGKMKTIGTIEEQTGLWYDPNTGATNESSFSALPSGYLNSEEIYPTYHVINNQTTKGYIASWWTSDNHSAECSYDGTSLNITNWGRIGMPVRCVQDDTAKKTIQK